MKSRAQDVKDVKTLVMFCQGYPIYELESSEANEKNSLLTIPVAFGKEPAAVLFLWPAAPSISLFPVAAAWLVS